MCQDCGCGDPNVVPIEVQHRILERNDETAIHNRQHFAADSILCVNLMGSPGGGKTAVLEATARAAGNASAFAALAGDLATDNDAERLRAAGIRSRAITTGQACHLDAELVHRALHDFSLQAIEYLFIENVGNLVCPANWDLGEASKIVLFSVTEGEDKPLKYPSMFQRSSQAVMTKTDLLAHVPFDLDLAMKNARQVNPDLEFFQLSGLTGDGMESWFEFLRASVRATGSVV